MMIQSLRVIFIWPGKVPDGKERHILYWQLETEVSLGYFFIHSDTIIRNYTILAAKWIDLNLVIVQIINFRGEEKTSSTRIFGAVSILWGDENALVLDHSKAYLSSTVIACRKKNWVTRIFYSEWSLRILYCAFCCPVSSRLAFIHSPASPRIEL